MESDTGETRSSSTLDDSIDQVEQSDNYYERELRQITGYMSQLGFGSKALRKVIKDEDLIEPASPPCEQFIMEGRQGRQKTIPLEVNVIEMGHQQYYQNQYPNEPEEVNPHEQYALASDALSDLRGRPEPGQIREAARQVQILEQALQTLGWEQEPVWLRRLDGLYTRLHGDRGRNERIEETRHNRLDGQIEDEPNDPFAFNSHSSPGSRGYYELFPQPWNVILFDEERGRGHPAVQSRVKIEIPSFGGKSHEDYYTWRACFIAHVHRSHQDVNSKMLALMQCLSENVKQNLASTAEYTPRGYHRVVTALERKFGGAKRLLTAALMAIRQMPAIRTDRIQDIERYVRDVETFFDRLDEADLREERLAQSTFKDLIRPLPFSYATDFYKDSRVHGIVPNSESLLVWMRTKLEEMQDVYEVKGSSQPHNDLPKEMKKNYSHFTNAWEEDDTGIESNEEKSWCLLVAQDRSGNCCPLCSSPKERADHSLTECKHFQRLPWNAKRVIFWQFRLCFYCGSRKHIATECKGPRCQKCGEGHHSILHKPDEDQPMTIPKGSPKMGSSFGVNDSEGTISLLTLTVRVRNPVTNETTLANCLLDSGSTLALMSTRLANHLNFSGYKAPLSLFGAGGKHAQYYAVLGEVDVENPNGTEKETVTVRVIDNPAGNHVVPEMSEMRSDLNIPPRAMDGKIDLILGCASPRLFVAQEICREADDKRVFMKTPLGWGMMGVVQEAPRLSGVGVSMFLDTIQTDSAPFQVVHYCKEVLDQTSTNYDLESQQESIDTGEKAQEPENCKSEQCFLESTENRQPRVTEKSKPDEFTSYKDDVHFNSKSEERMVDIIEVNTIQEDINDPDGLREEVQDLKCLTGLLEMQWAVEISCTKFSSYEKYLRTIIMIKRTWSHWLRQTFASKTDPSPGLRIAANKAVEERAPRDAITKEEMEVAKRDILRATQSEFCKWELNHLRRRGVVPTNSLWNGYSPYLDDHGIMRVGGRLHHSKFLPLDRRSPVIVPKGHPSEMLLEHIHQKEQLHAPGPEALHAKFNDKHFALSSLAAAKKLCYKCVQCRKTRARGIQPRMGELPLERVGHPGSRGKAFEAVQVDIMGPFLVSTGRRPRKEKRWALIIVCMLFKAVHIELLCGLSLKDIGNALERFTSRRGGASVYHSDNQPAFRALAKSFTEGSSTGQLEWRFVPPNTPHQMGLVEAGVKSTKLALNAELSAKSISEDDLATALVVVEGLLNTHPIASVPTSEGEVAVTTSDFLGAQGFDRLSGLVQRQRPISETAVAKRWIQMNKLLNKWWKLFYRAQISELHQRNRWLQKSRQLKEGDIVLLCEGDSSGGHWPMGVVVQAKEGKDGVVRLLCKRRRGKLVEGYPGQVVYLTDGHLMTL